MSASRRGARAARRATRDAATGLVLALACAACVRVSWISADTQSPVPPARLEALEVGVSDLDQVLAELGAPLFVWEADPRSYGLAFGWGEAFDWGFNVSVPVANEFSASLDYEDTNLALEGLVLFFGADDRLLRIERGRLSDLVPAERKRPAALRDQLGATAEGGAD